MFIIEINYELNNCNVTSIPIRIEFHNAMGHNCDGMDRIIVENHVCGIFNGITLIAIDKLIEML